MVEHFWNSMTYIINKQLLDLAVKENDKGNFYPVWEDV